MFSKSVVSIRVIRGGVRNIHSSRTNYSFISNLFGSKEVKQRKDIIQNQDDYEVDPNSKIVILDKKNSPQHEKFKSVVHMPDFKINEWKEKSVSRKELSQHYNQDDLVNIINDIHKELNGNTIMVESYQDQSLNDLSYRFKFAKELQSKLGFDINDYILTKSHNLKILFDEINQIISQRYLNERNPGDINLKPEDFDDSPNVYVSQELNEFEQKRKFNKLVEQARNAL